MATDTKRWTKREAKKLGVRIQILWMAVAMSQHSQGAYSWFARLTGVRQRTVQRWVHGTTSPHNSVEGEGALDWLSTMEEKFDVKTARKRWLRYRHGGGKRFERGQ